MYLRFGRGALWTPVLSFDIICDYDFSILGAMPVRSERAVCEARLFYGMLRNDGLSVFQRRLHEQNVEEKTYAETQRGLYEASDTQRGACGGRRPETGAADRGDEAVMGLHQEA